jgi:hypothetical protein
MLQAVSRHYGALFALLLAMLALLFDEVLEGIVTLYRGATVPPCHMGRIGGHPRRPRLHQGGILATKGEASPPRPLASAPTKAAPEYQGRYQVPRQSPRPPQNRPPVTKAACEYHQGLDQVPRHLPRPLTSTHSYQGRS